MLRDPTLLVSLLIVAFTVAAFVGVAVVMFNTPPKVLAPKKADGECALKRRTKWPRR